MDSRITSLFSPKVNIRRGVDPTLRGTDRSDALKSGVHPAPGKSYIRVPGKEQGPDGKDRISERRPKSPTDSDSDSSSKIESSDSKGHVLADDASGDKKIGGASGSTKISLGPIAAARFQEEQQSRISAVQAAGGSEKTAWADQYEKGGEFGKLIDAYVVEHAKLDKEIKERSIKPEEIAAKANKIAARLAVAYRFADENGFTKQTVDDCMDAGATFAQGSIQANGWGQAPGAARYVALAVTGIAQVALGITAATSPFLAGTLAAINLIYAPVQLAASVLGPVYNAAAQSEFGKQQTHLEPAYWTEVAPSKVVDRDGKTLLPNRNELEARIAVLKEMQASPADAERVANTADRELRYRRFGLGAEIGRAIKSIKLKEDLITQCRADSKQKHKLKFLKPELKDLKLELKLLRQKREQLEKTHDICELDRTDANRADTLYDLEVQLELVKLYHNLNAAENQGWGRAYRALFNMINPIISIANTAKVIPLGAAIAPGLQLAAQVIQPLAYRGYHGVFGGLDATDRLATCLQLGVLSSIGNLEKPGQPGVVDGAKLDAFGKGPMLLRLEGQKKILLFNARVHMLAMLATLADSHGNLPGRLLLSGFDKELKECESADDRQRLLDKLIKADKKESNFLPEAEPDSDSEFEFEAPPNRYKAAQRCLQLHEEALSDLQLVEHAIKTGDTSGLFSPECNLTVADKEMLLGALEFAANRCAPYIGKERKPDDAAARKADQDFAQRIGQAERLDYVGSVHQCIQKLGETCIGVVFGAGVPNIIQGLLGLYSGGLSVYQAGWGEKIPDFLSAAPSYFGSALSLVGSTVATQLGWTSRITGSVKNDARGRDKDIIMTLPGSGVMPEFPKLNAFPKTIETFTTLGGTDLQERKGLKLKFETPGTGIVDFRTHVMSMGTGPSGAYEIFKVARSAKGGKLDLEELKRIHSPDSNAGDDAAIAASPIANADDSSLVVSFSDEQVARENNVEALIKQLREINEEDDPNKAPDNRFGKILQAVDAEILAVSRLDEGAAIALSLAREMEVFLFAKLQSEELPTAIDLDSVRRLAKDALDVAGDPASRTLLKRLILPTLKKLVKALESDKKSSDKDLAELKDRMRTLRQLVQGTNVGEAAPEVDVDGEDIRQPNGASESNTESEEQVLVRKTRPRSSAKQSGTGSQVTGNSKVSGEADVRNRIARSAEPKRQPRKLAQPEKTAQRTTQGLRDGSITSPPSVTSVLSRIEQQLRACNTKSPDLDSLMAAVALIELEIGQLSPDGQQNVTGDFQLLRARVKTLKRRKNLVSARISQ